MAMERPDEQPRAWGDGLTWGDCLRIKVAKSGGLKGHVDRIQKEAGDIPIGSRQKFRDLFALEDPPEAAGDRFRAWALLVSLECDPEVWGVEVVLPSALSVPILKADFDGAGRVQRRRGDLGKPDSGWSAVLAGQLASAA